MADTRPLPSSRRYDLWTFDTVAAMKAAIGLKAGDAAETRGYFAADDGGGARYAIVTAASFGTPDGLGSHAITSTLNGSLVASISNSRDLTPRSFGAACDGLTDDILSLRAFVAYKVAKGVSSASFSPVRPFDGQVTLDFGGVYCAISDELSFPARSDLLIMGLSMIAIGAGWTSTKYMVRLNADNSWAYSLTLDGAGIANTFINAAGQHNRLVNAHFVRMSTAWTSDGVYVPQNGCTDFRMIGCYVRQWKPGNAEFIDATKFTANLVRIEQSDCKLSDTSLFWGKCCYKATKGTQFLTACHLVNGREGQAGTYPALATDTQLIEWGIPGGGSGELVLEGVYLDNGKCDFYADQIRANVYLLSDTADSILTDGMLRMFAPTGGKANPSWIGEGAFLQWNSTYDLFRLKAAPTDAAPWGTPSQTLYTNANNNFSASTKNDTTFRWGRRLIDIWDEQPNTSRKNYSNSAFTINGPGIAFDAYSAEPAGVVNGTQLRSDGTASTNGFGVYGPGIYQLLSGSWSPDFRSPQVAYMPAAITKAASATLTPAELATGLVKYTGAAADVLTMPLATDLDTALGLATGMGIEFSICNAGTLTISIATNTGISLAGGVSIAASASATFRARRSAAGAYTITRIAG